MIRMLLVVLALIVLVAAALFYMGVLNWPGGSQPVQVNPVEVKMETRQVNVQVPVMTTNPGEAAPVAQPAQPAQPAAAQPANAQ